LTWRSPTRHFPYQAPRDAMIDPDPYARFAPPSDMPVLVAAAIHADMIA
jgi:hypothetical protein